MARRINQEGLDLIKQWEGLFLTAYHGAADRPGLLTIGYGHTDAAGPPKVVSGMRITRQEAENILRADLSWCEKAVDSLVKVPLNDNQFATLVSFVFNVGEGAFSKSTLLRKLNAGNLAAVPSELMKWTKANGVYVKGLANRRAAEAGLWAKGDFVSSNTVEPDSKPEKPSISPEILGPVISGAGGIVASLAGGSPVLQGVLAAVIITGLIIGVVFIWRRMKDESR